MRTGILSTSDNDSINRFFSALT